MSIFDMFSRAVVISILIIDYGQTSNTSELHIGALFPTKLRNGVAFEECVDVGLLRDSVQHDYLLRNYTLFFHNLNSQCESDVTQDIKHLYAQPPRLLVVSGGCSPNLSRHLSSDIVHISSQESDVAITVQNTFSVALWLGSGSPGLSGYLASHQISIVSLIHQNGEYYEKIVFSLSEHLNYYNIQTSPLLLSGHITNDVIHMETNFIRHVILIANDVTMIELLCQLYQRPTLPHVFFIFTNKPTCNILSKMICNGVSDWSIQDITCVGVATPIDSFDPVNDCAFAHDAAMTTLYALNGSNPIVINSFISATTPMPGTRIELNDELTRATQNTQFFGKTGHVTFSVLGIRSSNISACRLHQNDCLPTYHYDTVLDEVFQDPVVPGENVDIISFRELEIELSDVIYMCMAACAGLMALLSFVLLICNIKYRSNRILKLTSPNLTVTQLLGAMVTLGGIPVFGLSNGRIIYHISASLFTIGFTLQYGSFIVKQWRVYAIFKALQPRRKPIKDELLLFLIFGLVGVDVIILITWWLLDPIQCHQVTRIPFYQKTSDNYVIESVTACSSKLIWLWLGVIYFSKLLLMTSGLYLAYKTRHVSSPPLRDSRSITLCCYVTACLGLTILPIAGSDSLDLNVKYTLTCMAVFVTTGHATILLVAPKILIMHEMSGADKSRQESLRFDTSLKLSENNHRSIWCFCWKHDTSKKKPEYGETLLVGELVTLRNVLKEKEARIRELNDRLYFGTDHFRAYITNGNKRVHTIRTKAGKSHDRRATVGDVRPEKHGQNTPIHASKKRASLVEDSEFEEGFGNAGFVNGTETYTHQCEHEIPIGSFDKVCRGDDMEENKTLNDNDDIENNRRTNWSPLESGIGMDDRYENDFKGCPEFHGTEQCDEALYRSNYKPNQKQPKHLHRYDGCNKITTVSESVDTLTETKDFQKDLGLNLMSANDNCGTGMLQPSPVIERRNVAYAHRRLTNSPASVYNIETAEQKSKNPQLGREDYIDHKKYIQYI